MQIKQIRIPLEEKEPVGKLEKGINDALREVCGRDALLSLCHHDEKYFVGTGYSAIVLYDANPKNRLTAVRLFCNWDKITGPPKSFEDRINEYLVAKEIDSKDVSYSTVTMGFGHQIEIVMVKHREIK